MTLGWLLGNGAQLQQPVLWSQNTYFLLGAIAALIWITSRLWLRKNHSTQATHIHTAQSTQNALLILGALLSLCCAACVSFSSTGVRAVSYAAQQLNPTYEGTDVAIEARIVDLPRWSSQPNAAQHNRESTVRLLVDVQRATLEGREIRLPQQLRLSWYSRYAPNSALHPPHDLRIGQTWRWTVRLKAPHGNLNPHGFDYELWLWAQGIGATGYVRNHKAHLQPQLLQQPSWWRNPIGQWRQRQRDRVQRILAHQPQIAGVVAALLTGDQAAIDQKEWALYRDTGTAHLMSISGLHITMFAWLAIVLVGRLWRCSERLCTIAPAPHAALLGGLLLATLYALFSGFAIPAQRTVCMLAVVVAMRLSGYQWPWYLTLLCVAVGVTALDPWAMLQPGFWLSFVAVGILLAHGTLLSPVRENEEPTARLVASPTLPSNHTPKWWQRLGAYVYALVREQTVITWALAPLTLWLFKQASLVGWIANLIAVPWVTFVITPLTMLGVVWGDCWQLAGWMLEHFNAFLRYAAALPHAVLYLAVRPWWLHALAVVGAIAMVLPLRWWWRAAGVAALTALLLWQPPRIAHGDFRLTFLDVGQGAAVHVETAQHHLVYDTGAGWSNSSAAERIVIPYLRAQGVQQLDRIVVSHDDNDHSGGLPALQRAYPHADVSASYAPPNTSAQFCRQGQGWEWDGVQFTWLHPAATDLFQNNLNDNDKSCVLSIQQTQAPFKRAILTGDITKRIEQHLVQHALERDAQASDLEADVLMLAHHGSHSSSSQDFLWAVSPDFAISQSGYGNNFGHPAQRVTQRLRKMGIEHADTQRCGALQWLTTQPKQLHCYRATHARYWRHRIATR